MTPLRDKHAQLIELCVLCERFGHGLHADNPDECEVCCSLCMLRRRVSRRERDRVARLIHEELDRRSLEWDFCPDWLDVEEDGEE